LFERNKEEFVAEQMANTQGVLENFVLEQNFPNPFPLVRLLSSAGAPETMIRFDLPERSIVIFKIFNLAGHEIAILLDRVEFPAGGISARGMSAKRRDPL
jgi:hypothetical protein